VFDLEDAIRRWKRALAASPALEDGYVAELEAGLRDEVAARVRAGQAEEAAFREAAAEMGTPEAVGAEFHKAHTTRRSGRPPWRTPRLIPPLAWNMGKVAVRQMRRYKGYALIHVAGLTVGMLCFLLIMVWVRSELSYDDFHVRRDRVYRLLYVERGDGRFAAVSYALPPGMAAEIPEVEAFARVWPWTSSLVRYGTVRHQEDAIHLTDPDFFRIFSFAFVRGTPDTALPDPHSVVLTESAARRYFGDAEPLGKVLHVEEIGEDFRVTGVIRDVPPNSHLQFELMGRVDWLGRDRLARWEEWVGPAYVMLRPGASPEAVNAKAAALFRSRLGEMQLKISPVLEPLSQVHLHEDGSPENLRRVIIFSGIALLILIVACVNFMNLSTMRATLRAREVGLRKVVGASRSLVAAQFLGEAMGLATLSMGLAVLGGYLLLPLVNQAAGLSLRLFGNDAAVTLAILAGATLATGLLSGSYPAFVLSAYRPVDTIRNRVVAGRGGVLFRKILIVFQLTVSVGLILCTLIVARQLRYIQTKDLGLNRDQVVVLSNNPRLNRDFDAFKTQLESRAGIVRVTAASQIPTDVGTGLGVWPEGGTYRDRIGFGYCDVDYDFFETFRMTIVRGRAFSREFPADAAQGCLINEKAAAALGWPDPVGHLLHFNHPGVDPERQRLRIIGVVRDFHSRPLQEAVRPFLFRMYRPWHTRVFVRVKPDRVPEALAAIKDVFGAFAPAYTFRYRFMDELYQLQYRAETQLGLLFDLFSVLACFVAGLGLFGLSSFTAERMTKEIGIRKACGAPLRGIVALILRKYAGLVVVANLLAWLAGYLLMTAWLDQFAYRVALRPDVFLAASGLMVLVVGVSVGYRTLRAATAQPVDALRYE
jgi:putative ABC transport system permease protein